MSGIALTRREAGGALLGGALALVVPGAAPARAASVPLLDFAIAGGWYHGLCRTWKTLAVGERLVLRAEPENPCDANAVAVHRADGLMLGYVPRAANPPIARLLRGGATIEAEIVGRLDQGDGEEGDALAFTSFMEGDPRIRLTLWA